MSTFHFCNQDEAGKLALAEHRSRINKLLYSEGDYGFENSESETALYDVDEAYPAVEDMFKLPTPPPSPARDSPSPPLLSPTTADDTPPSPATAPPLSPARDATTPPPSPTPSISSSVHSLARYINQLRKNKDGLPSRNLLRRDERLRGEIHRRDGVLLVRGKGSKLRRHARDGRLFDDKVWQWLLHVKAEEVDDEAYARHVQNEVNGLRVRRSQK